LRRSHAASEWGELREISNLLDVAYTGRVAESGTSIALKTT
jgi:hypothetical protein